MKIINVPQNVLKIVTPPQNILIRILVIGNAGL